MARDTADVVVPLVVLIVVIVTFLVCCCHNGKLVHPRVKWEYYRSIWLTRQIGTFLPLENVTWFASPVEVLIKRCDQTTTREVEDTIIHNVHLNGQQWNQHHDLGQKPVVVFCVISSRIGTDIDSAMRGVNEYSPVILVLLHFQSKGQLGNKDLTDNEYLLDERTKRRMVGFAHFAFSEYEGLYSCSQNNYGFQRVKEHVQLASRNQMHGVH